MALSKDRVDKVRRRIRITTILEEVGRHYKEKGVAELEIRRDEIDIHAFYRLTADPSKVVYVQVSSSSDENMILRAVVQNYEEDMKFRAPNEERLTVSVPYDAKALKELLAKNVPELR